MTTPSYQKTVADEGLFTYEMRIDACLLKHNYNNYNNIIMENIKKVSKVGL